MRYALIDISNMVHRMSHTVPDQGSFDDAIGTIISMVFYAIKNASEQFNAEKCVICFDHGSWRKEIFPEYKADRGKDQSPVRLRRDEYIFATIENLHHFFYNHTNVITLQKENIEADDFISRWIVHAPNDEHIIISADKDFVQLLKPNVELYDPMFDKLYNMAGCFQAVPNSVKEPEFTMYNKKWNYKLDKKGNNILTEPEWALFFQCIRGKKNNLRSAFPNVRETKMREAFNDKGGPLWNNFINSIWGSENNRQYVRNRYELNKQLLDLSMQPDSIKNAMDQAILEQLESTPKHFVGQHFRKMCGQYELTRIGNNPLPFIKILS